MILSISVSKVPKVKAFINKLVLITSNPTPNPHHHHYHMWQSNKHPNNKAKVFSMTALNAAAMPLSPIMYLLPENDEKYVQYVHPEY